MDDIYGKLDIHPQHFQASKATDDCLPEKHQMTDYSLRFDFIFGNVK